MNMELAKREDILPGPMKKNFLQHPQKTYLISRFDQNGVKTPDLLHSVTYEQANRIVTDFAKGLLELGFNPGDRLVVFGPNRPRWIYACSSAIVLKGIHVPIYPNSKQEDVWWIMKDSGARLAVCSSKAHADQILAVTDRLDVFEKIILMDPLPRGYQSDSDSTIMPFNDVCALGAQSDYTDESIDSIANSIKPDDVAAIIYTSGTTGRPKGVMLTHQNFSAQNIIAPAYDFTDKEVFFSHLPLCHCFGFSSDFLNAGNNAATLFISDSVETEELRQNIKDCRPTVMSSVPRLWEKLYIKLDQTIASKPPFVQKLVKWAMGIGKEMNKRNQNHETISLGLKLSYRFASRIFDKIKTEAGLDRLKYSYTGGGPIDSKLIDFFGGLGIRLFQGYGLTETSPIICANTPEHNRIGTVGKPLPNVEIRISDDGEILVKAPQVMKGYYQNPDATSQTLSADGWLATGDIGKIDQDGFLHITDRKKELLITSGGKNIAPQPIENEFNIDPFIDTVCLIGDGRKFISALIVPEFDNIKSHMLERHDLKIEDNEELLGHPEVKALLDERVKMVNQRLARYEQIKKYTFLSQPFSEHTGELTPTMKKKRRVILEKYHDYIEQMYQ